MWLKMQTKILLIWFITEFNVFQFLVTVFHTAPSSISESRKRKKHVIRNNNTELIENKVFKGPFKYHKMSNKNANNV